jgi:hypothetical protein
MIPSDAGMYHGRKQYTPINLGILPRKPSDWNTVKSTSSIWGKLSHFKWISDDPISVRRGGSGVAFYKVQLLTLTIHVP